MSKIIFFSIAFALGACAPLPPPAPEAKDARPALSPAVADAHRPTPPADPRVRFVDATWRVETSSAVAPGTLYRFRFDGTLLIDAPGSTPGIGRWTWEHGALTMIEEGIAYPTEILALDDKTFAIRSHNPGQPVDIKMVRVDAAASTAPASK